MCLEVKKEPTLNILHVLTIYVTNITQTLLYFRHVTIYLLS